MNRWLALSLTLALVALGGSLYLYGFQREQWPEQVAIHWGIDGKPDGFVSRDNLLALWLGVPLGMVAWVGVTLLLPWLSPKQFAIEPFRGTYDYVMSLVNIFLLYIHGVVLFGAFGNAGHAGTWIIGGVFLLFAMMGNILGRVRCNFWMGIRTPWTLADEGVWNATHRHAAYVYTIAGIVGFVGVLAGIHPMILFVGIILAALWPVLYSLIVYKYRDAHGLLTPTEDEKEIAASR